MLAIVISAWFVYPVFRLQYQQRREVQTLQSELDSVKARNEELRAQIEALKTPQGIERLARENLGLVKPGEQAYVVTGGAAEEPTPTAYAQHTIDVPLWQRVLDAVFGFD